MEHHLARIARTEGGLLGARKVKSAFKMWWMGVGMELILEEIRIYRRTMKISLQFITV